MGGMAISSMAMRSMFPSHYVSSMFPSHYVNGLSGTRLLRTASAFAGTLSRSPTRLAISTVALAEEVVEVLRSKARGASAEERTGLKSLSEFFAALRPSRPALPPPVGKRRRFGKSASTGGDAHKGRHRALLGGLLIGGSRLVIRRVRSPAWPRIRSQVGCLCGVRRKCCPVLADRTGVQILSGGRMMRPKPRLADKR